jgi:hypothetical protein
MGDDVVTTTGVANGTETAAPTARTTMSRAEQDAADKAAFLAADLNADVEPEKPAAPAPKKKPAPAAEVEADDDDIDEDDDPADELDEDLDDLVDDEVEADDDKDEDEDAPKDADTEKRIAQVRRAEQRHREQAAARDREFEQRKQAFVEQWRPKLEAAEAFDKIPKHDIAAILKAKGYTEEDFEDASRMIYGLSKAAAADPKNRDAVLRMQRERELRDDVKAANERSKALEEKLAKQESEQQQNAFVEKYMGRVHKAITDETPLAKKRIELAPRATKQALAKIAHQLSEKKGELANPKTVARLYEKRLGKALESARKLAGDEAAAVTEKPKAKPAAIVKPAAKSITVVDKTAQVNGKKPGVLPSRDEMIAGLGKLERGEIALDDDLD